MKRDASDIAFGDILSQIENGETLNPFVFRLWKFEVAKINYEIDNKVLLAIVDFFKSSGIIYLRILPTKLLSVMITRISHMFNNARVLNPQQDHLARFLTCSNLIIYH